jgi:CHAT domain-containing protein
VSSPEDLRRAGSDLREALFGDWLNHLDPETTLLIQIDPIFPDLAFAALPGRADPLGIEHPLSITTLPILRHSRPLPAERTSHEFLLVDASQSNAAWLASFPPLPSADREIASVRRAAPHAIIVEGERATASSIAEKSLGAGVMHFIGHAVNTPAGVSLLLPGSATPVSMDDLRHAGFRPPPTIVLSACSTGRRTQSGNATPGSLAAALLFEGSSDVIASLWSVDSESAATFMEEFYRLVAGGSDAGAAVRGAMRHVRQSPGYSHPYYWASFARFVRI